MKEFNLVVVEKNLPSIVTNFDEVKEALLSNMEEFKNLVVTEQTLSVCKEQQRKLAGLRNDIEDSRKTIKKEMAKPIDEFESQMKDLVKIIQDTEQPLKDGIKVYDDQRREEKRKFAEKCIAEAVANHGIRPEFAQALDVIDQYLLLGATANGVKESIEERAMFILNKQQQYDDRMAIIASTIDSVNKTISAQIGMHDIKHLLNDSFTTSEIITEINRMAEKIRESEKLAEQKAAEKLEKLEKDLQKAKEERNAQVAPSLPPAEPKAVMFEVELKIKDTKERVEALAKFMKDNRIKYEVISQNKVSE